MTPSRRHRGDGALYQRADGTWVGSVDLPATGDGRRRRRTVSSRDHATALRKLRALRDATTDGTDAGTDRATVATWLGHWLDTIAAPTLRPKTRDSYAGTIRLHLVPHLGAMPLRDLTPAHIRAMHRAVLRTHPSGRTAQLAHRILAKSLTDAVAEGVLPRNPADPVTAPTPTTAPVTALTAEQARTLLVHAATTGDPLASRWAAALLLGGRQGELLGLEWDRVDLDRGTVDLSWQLQPVPRGTDGRWQVPHGYQVRPLHGALCLVPPKSKAGTRLVPIPAPLALVLAEHRRTTAPNRHGLVWATEDGRPLDRWVDGRRWRAACDAAGVPRVRLHSARHTTATLLLEAGVDTHIVSAILGHSAAVVTRGYQHVSLDLSRAAMSNLGALLGPTS